MDGRSTGGLSVPQSEADRRAHLLFDAVEGIYGCQTGLRGGEVIEGGWRGLRAVCWWKVVRGVRGLEGLDGEEECIRGPEVGDVWRATGGWGGGGGGGVAGSPRSSGHAAYVHMSGVYMSD